MAAPQHSRMNAKRIPLFSREFDRTFTPLVAAVLNSRRVEPRHLFFERHRNGPAHAPQRAFRTRGARSAPGADRTTESASERHRNFSRGRSAGASFARG